MRGLNGGNLPSSTPGEKVKAAIMVQAIRDRAWVDFRAWCVARRLRALPAHPWTVAAYARFCQARHTPKTITEKLAVIGRVHLSKGHRAPDGAALVKRTLAELRRERAKSGRLKGPVLFKAEDFVSADPVDPADPAPPKRSSARASGPLRQRPPLVSRRPK